MAESPTSTGRPLRWLAAKLVATTLAAGAIYVFFTIFNHRFLGSFSEPEILLLEAVAVIVIAYAIARSVTTASSEILARRGLLSHGHVVRLFANLVIAIVAVVALFNLAGVPAESIFLGSALAGIVLGLAAQTVLSNVFAGLLLVFADPFRPGDRVSFVSSSYPVIWPTYPHEITTPAYSGTIEDVGLVYTVLRLDSGLQARLPNAVVLGSLVLQPRSPAGTVHRVRVTVPIAVSTTVIEGALPEIQRAFPKPSPLDPAARFEVADVTPASWDGVFVLTATEVQDGRVRDGVLRIVLPRIAAALRSPGAPATP
jgi:small-conductance mechanosensitive channel